jgi:hypothetical protein
MHTKTHRQRSDLINLLYFFRIRKVSNISNEAIAEYIGLPGKYLHAYCSCLKCRGEGLAVYCSTLGRYWKYNRRGSSCRGSCSKSLRFVITVHFLTVFLEIFTELSLVFQGKKWLLFSFVDCHVKRLVHSLEKFRRKLGKMEDVVLLSISSGYSKLYYMTDIKIAC